MKRPLDAGTVAIVHSVSLSHIHDIPAHAASFSDSVLHQLALLRLRHLGAWDVEHVVLEAGLEDLLSKFVIAAGLIWRVLTVRSEWCQRSVGLGLHFARSGLQRLVFYI